MKTESVRDFVSNLSSLGVGSTFLNRGFTVDEIRSVEVWAGSSLPLVYKDFLLQVGRGVGGSFGSGIDFFFRRPKDLIDLKAGAEELIEECGRKFELPPNALVFSMSEGYQFMYFLLGHGDDPPVYYYMEGRDEAETISDSFTKYLASIVVNVERERR